MKKMLIILMIFFVSSLAWANYPSPSSPVPNKKKNESPDPKNSVPCYFDEQRGMLCKINEEWKTPIPKEPWVIQQVPIIIRREIVAYNIFAYNTLTGDQTFIAPSVKIVKTQWAKTVRSLGRTGAVMGVLMQAIFWMPFFIF